MRREGKLYTCTPFSYIRIDTHSPAHCPTFINPLPCIQYLCPIHKEAVQNRDGSGAVHDGEEKSEEPTEADHGQDLQPVLQQLVDLRQVLLCQLLKHHCKREREGEGGREGEREGGCEEGIVKM